MSVLHASKRPLRTCAGCRKRDRREALLRLVASGDGRRPVADVIQRLPGRGVWVHRRPDCLERAVSRGALRRALRRPIEATPGSIAAEAGSLYRARVDELIGAARRRRVVACGPREVRRAIDSRQVALLVVAEDALSGQGLRHRQGFSHCATVSDGKRLDLAARRNCEGVLAVLDTSLAARLAHAAGCDSELAEAR